MGRIKLRKIAIILICMLSMLITACSNGTNKDTQTTAKVVEKQSKENAAVTDLKVSFIDVGQADCILIQQGKAAMLIDAGNNEDKETIKDYLNKQGVKSLDCVIGTHVHEDHIGSMDDVIKSFKIGKVIFPKQTANTKTFENFINAVTNKGLNITAPNVGDNYKLGEAAFTILAPNSATYEDANDYSVVVKLQYGNSKFLLTGDAEAVSEKEMVGKGLDLKADVLKVGHHGSRTSTSASFLKAVSPKYAVISVGKDNTYGHPVQSTMDRLKNSKIQVYRTDEQGTIVVTSNGNEIKFNTSPGSYNGK